MTQDRISRDLQHLANRVVAARAAVRRGEVVEVTVLRDEAQRICGAIDALPAAEGKKLRPTMIGLLEETDALAAALRAALDILREQMGGSNDRRRALKAYGQPDGGRGGAP